MECSVLSERHGLRLNAFRAWRPQLDEIADGIYRLSTFVPEVGPARRLHLQPVPDRRPTSRCCSTPGPRGDVPLVAEAVATVVPVESVRWITFGHVESDECGSMNMWLAAAPRSQVAHGAPRLQVSLDDMCDRPPRPLADGEVIDLGGKRVRHIDTPHVPHGWEARVLFEETTGTLLCGDLFTHLGGGGRRSPPTTSSSRPWPPRPCSARRRMAPDTADVMRRLGDLRADDARRSCTARPTSGDGGKALYDLADAYEHEYLT